MFRFIHSLFDRDDGVEAVPLLAEEDPELPTDTGRVLDVSGMLVQASSRVPVGRLRQLGKKVVSLLSRRKIDELVNRAIRRFVERSGSAAGAAALPPDAVTGIRKEFDELLSQQLGSALDGQPSAAGRGIEMVDATSGAGVSLDRLELEPGRGLHVGSERVSCAASLKADGEVVVASQRNAFLDVVADESTKKLLRRLDLSYVSHDGAGYIVGDPAVELGRIFGKTSRLPMRHGTLSPDEPLALFILSLLLRQVAGPASTPGEICVVAVPADPVEGDRNFIYHLGAVDSALRALGYEPRPMTEGHLLVSTELKDQDYSGIGVSCGAGLANVGIAYKGLPVLGFSAARGGDWIDENVAAAVGLPADEVARIRMGDMDLESPQGRVEGAIQIYTRTLLHSLTESLRMKLGEAHALPSFGRPVPVVCAGSAVMGRGFLELFKDELEKAHLPLRIDYLRLARDPLTAVARGCLEAALEETRAEGQGRNETAPAVLERAAVSGVPQRGLPSLSDFRKSRAG
jgi:hypothetical protein